MNDTVEVITHPKRGRPSTKVDHRALDYIVGEIENKGRSIKSILNDTVPGVILPTYRSLMRWKSDHPEIERIITNARENMVEQLIDELIDMANQPKPQYLHEAEPKLQLAWDLANRRTKADVNKFLIEKLKQSKYGHRKGEIQIPLDPGKVNLISYKDTDSESKG